MSTSNNFKLERDLCRCCHSEGTFYHLTEPVYNLGQREVYSEMLKTCLDLDVLPMVGELSMMTYKICGPCVLRLRDAHNFKQQIILCEERFKEMYHNIAIRDITASVEIKEELPGSYQEEVKKEYAACDDDDGFDIKFDDSDDDQPVIKIKVEESKTAKTKPKTSKVTQRKKKAPAKKSQSAKNTSEQPQLEEPVVEKGKKGKKGETVVQRNSEKRDGVRSSRNKNATILIQHSRICPFKWVNNFYHCFYCENKFLDPVDLRRHNEIHEPQQHELEINLRKLKKHNLVKVDITDVSCRKCDETIKDFSHLVTHLTEVHKKNLDPESYYGVLPFKLANNVDFPCALCPQKYEEFTSLNHHMNTHFQRFICEICGSGFITPERLRTHISSHETGSYPCSACPKTFRSSYLRKEHIDHVHKKVQRNHCPHCPETFRYHYQRNKHMASIHGVKLKEFKCLVCQKEFNTSGALGVHNQTVHLKVKRYTCDICEWKCYCRAQLHKHNIKHVGEKIFKCDVCTKAFARKPTLKEHLKIHKDDRRFLCNVCGAAFVQNSSMKYHIKVHHPDDASARAGKTAPVWRLLVV